MQTTMPDTRVALGPALLLLLGSCLPILGAVLIAPLLPSIQRHFSNESNVMTLVPVMLTIPALMIALTAPMAGWIVDRVGRKRLLLLALPVYGVFGTAPLWLQSLDAILLSRVGLGLAEAAIITCCTTLIGDYYEGAARARMLGLQTVASSVSAILFFVLGGALGEFGWRTPFWLYAVGFALAPLAAVLLWEPARPLAVGLTAKLAAPRQAFPWRPMSVIYLITGCAAILFFVVAIQLGFVLDAMGIVSTRDIGLAIAASHLAVLASSIGFRWLNRIAPPLLLLCGFAVSGAGLLWLAHAATYREVVLAVIVNGLGGGLLVPTLVTWGMATLPFALRGRGTGGFMTSFYIGQFMSPLVMIAISGAQGLSAAIGTLGIASLLIGAACTAAPRLAGMRTAEHDTAATTP